MHVDTAITTTIACHVSAVVFVAKIPFSPVNSSAQGDVQVQIFGRRISYVNGHL